VQTVNSKAMARSVVDPTPRGAWASRTLGTRTASTFSDKHGGRHLRTVLLLHVHFYQHAGVLPRDPTYMAPPSFSPDTSISSHTLSTGSTAAPAMHNPVDLMGSIDPLEFLQPNRNLQSKILSLSKHHLDHVASSISEAQSQRQQELRKKKKRTGGDFDMDMNVLHLKKLHVDGFSVKYVS